MRIPFTNIVIGTDTRRGNTLATSVSSIGISQKKNISVESMFAIYRDNADVYSCVREWSENVGMGGWTLTRKNGEVTPKEYAVINGIFNSLNAWIDLKTETVMHLGVTANAYWEKVYNVTRTEVVGLNPLDPRTIHIVCDTHGTILKYIQKNGQATVEFDPKDIIHFRTNRDPDRRTFGLSPIEPMFWEAITDEQAKRTNYHFFENRARPGVWYILDANLAEDAREKLIDTIKENLGGAKNYNKSAILQGVKEIKTFDITSKDMEYLQGRAFVTDKVCSAYGVPKFLLGYTDTTNYNNGRELMRKFYEGTIAPLEARLADTINRYLLKDIFPDITFSFNPVSFTEESEVERRALLEYTTGVITLRQYKKKTNQEITPEDEANPNFDSYIMQNGGSAVLLEDIGVDPAALDPEQFVNILKKYDDTSLSRKS